jgi:hypothetical protein
MGGTSTEKTGGGITLFQAREIGRKLGLAQAATIMYRIAGRTECEEIAIGANAIVEFAASGLTSLPEERIPDAVSDKQCDAAREAKAATHD